MAEYTSAVRVVIVTAVWSFHAAVTITVTNCQKAHLLVICKYRTKMRGIKFKIKKNYAKPLVGADSLAMEPETSLVPRLQQVHLSL
jgi:hypothetical protein